MSKKDLHDTGQSSSSPVSRPKAGSLFDFIESLIRHGGKNLPPMEIATLAMDIILKGQRDKSMQPVKERVEHLEKVFKEVKALRDFDRPYLTPDGQKLDFNKLDAREIHARLQAYQDAHPEIAVKAEADREYIFDAAAKKRQGLADRATTIGHVEAFASDTAKVSVLLLADSAQTVMKAGFTLIMLSAGQLPLAALSGASTVHSLYELIRDCAICMRDAKLRNEHQTLSAGFGTQHSGYNQMLSDEDPVLVQFFKMGFECQELGLYYPGRIPAKGEAGLKPIDLSADSCLRWLEARMAINEAIAARPTGIVKE